MFGNLRSDRFARLFSYDQARKHYESIKPYAKGRNKGKYPFAERGRFWLQIRRDWDDVVIKLYQTDIIRFKPNGDIVVDQGGWNSATTHETIARILGTEIMQRDFNGWIKARVEGSNEQGFYVLPKQGECVFRGIWREVLSGSGSNKYYEGLRYINPPATVTHKLNRARYAEVMQMYKPFMDYMRRMVKLVSNADGEVSWQSAGATEDEIPPLITAKTICEAMLDVSANGHMLYLLFLRDAIRAKHPYHYRREENGLPVKWEHISKEIRTVIKRGHVEFIFDKHEVLNGRVVKDTNRKYGV